MAVCRLVCVAVFSYLLVLSAHRVADKRLLHEADSFLTRRHGARESEQEKRTEAPLAALGVQETSNDTRTDVKVGLPKCSNGSLQLDGVYEVKDQEEVVLVEEPSCRVMGSAQLLLSTPVQFQGNAVFAGNLSVKAVGDGKMQGPCITVKGNLTLQPEAHLSLEGGGLEEEEEEEEDEEEEEEEEEEEGGWEEEDEDAGSCLRVGGDAELLGGHLQLNGCTALNGRGGGIAVGGRIPAFAALSYIERRRLRTRAH
ncbi:unnamed protein product [Symbiodinium sp. CCMP2456]|nr:unnamed protein product [Symbiodinium sp. CCMP2456]